MREVFGEDEDPLPKGGSVSAAKSKVQSPKSKDPFCLGMFRRSELKKLAELVHAGMVSRQKKGDFLFWARLRGSIEEAKR